MCIVGVLYIASLKSCELQAHRHVQLGRLGVCNISVIWDKRKLA